jgi:phosphoribosyl 1,2-cyclic phosphodiesterase
METDSGGLLVDAGLSRRRIESHLASIGRSLGDVGAILLTHGHSDHTCGVRSLVRDRTIPVFAAPGVGDSLGAKAISPGEKCVVGGLAATFFQVPHDSLTYGVRISDETSAVAMATDLGEAGIDVLRCMRGAEAVVLESNHDHDWLRRGPYSSSLKRRISSRHGHLSNRQAGEAAVALAPHGLKDLVLAHLSKTNNSPTRACGTVHGALREAGHGGVRVRAAIAGQPTPWIEVGTPLQIPDHVYRYDETDAAGQLFGIE